MAGRNEGSWDGGRGRFAHVWKDRGGERKGEYQMKDQLTSWKDGPVLEFKSRGEGGGLEGSD